MADAYLPKDVRPTESQEPYLPDGVSGKNEEHVKIISHPQPRTYTDEDRRRDALKSARKTHRGAPAQQIVASAKLYEAFLKGE